MSDNKTIQDALAEIQRKVNEERAARVAELMDETVARGHRYNPKTGQYEAPLRKLKPDTSVGKQTLTPETPKAAPTTPKTVAPSTPKPDVAGKMSGSGTALGKAMGTSGQPAGAPSAGTTGKTLGTLGKVGATGAALGAGSGVMGGIGIGGVASGALGALATGTETGRAVGKWIGQNVPGAKETADVMRKAGEAIGIREPKTAEPSKPAETPKTEPAPTTTPKPETPKPEVSKPSTFGQAFAAARKSAAEKGAKSTGQFEFQGKKYQTNIQGTGTPKAPEEKYVPMSQQTKVDTSSAAPKPAPLPPTRPPELSAPKEPGAEASSFVRKELNKPETESGGKKKKMSEDVNEAMGLIGPGGMRKTGGGTVTRTAGKTTQWKDPGSINYGADAAKQSRPQPTKPVAGHYPAPDRNKLSSVKGWADPGKIRYDLDAAKSSRPQPTVPVAGKKFSVGSHYKTELNPSQPGEQATMKKVGVEKGWSDPGRWENEVRSKTGTMQQIRTTPDRHVVDTPTQQVGKPAGETSTSNFLKSQGVGTSTESGGKKKMSEDTNPLIAAFLKLQSENPQNMFEAAKKAKKDYDKDGKIESPKDEVWGSRFRAAKAAGKMEEGKEETAVWPEKTVHKTKPGVYTSSTRILPKDRAAYEKDVFEKGAKAAKVLSGKKMEEATLDPNDSDVTAASKTITKKPYEDPSTPKVPYSQLPKTGNAAGSVLDKAKDALDKKGVREDIEEITFSEAELEHFNRFFNEAPVAPSRPEVARGADSVSDKMSQNDVTGTSTESGKKKVKEEVELEEGRTDGSKMSDMDKHRHAYAQMYGRSPTLMKPNDKLSSKLWNRPASDMRTTKSGKIHGQDQKAKANEIKSRLGSHTKANLPEETLEEGKEVEYKGYVLKQRPFDTDVRVYKNGKHIQKHYSFSMKDAKDSIDFEHGTKNVAREEKPVREETLQEGRPKKNPTPETTERDPRKHIQVEAGRAAAGNVIDFPHNDGTKSKITPAMGRRIVAHLQGLKPADRQAAVNKMHDSAEGLKV